MTKDFAKVMILKSFVGYVESHIKMRNEAVTPIVFDSWVAGYISGLTTGFPELSNETDVKEIVDSLVQSDLAKSCGVTGTEAEHFQILPITE